MDTLKFFEYIGGTGRMIALICLAYCCRLAFDKIYDFFIARYKELQQALNQRKYQKALKDIREKLPFENTVDDLMVFDKEESEKILKEMEFGYEWE